MPKKQAKAHASAREIPPDLRGGRWRLAAVIALLIVLPVAVYGRVVGFDFVNYDDWEYVTQNPRIAEGLTAETVAWAFTTVEMSNWHPLTYLSYLLDAQLFGVRGGAFHAVNLLFHVANTLLLFAVLTQMTGAAWRSALVAALFAIHPQHVESVAWISERKDVLSVFFGLLAVGAYVKYARGNSMKWYALAFLSYGCSLLCKPTLVTLPCLLLLLDWWPLQRSKTLGSEAGGIADLPSPFPTSADSGARQPRARNWMHLILEKVPFLLLAALFSAVAVFAQGHAVASIHENSFTERLGNAAVAYCLYIVRLFWPVGLAVMYPHPGSSLPAWQIAASILFLSAGTAGVVGLRKNHPYLAVGWFWFLGTMVPMIGFIQVGVQQMADRYAYFPMIGLYVALAWGASALAGSDANRRRAACIAAAVFMLGLAGAAWVQVGYWRNGETLFRRTLKVTTNNPIAHINLAQALHHDVLQSEFKDRTAAIEKLDDAIAHYEEALRLDDRYATAHKNLAQALSLRYQLANESAGQRTLEVAIQHYSEGIRLEPEAATNDVAHFEIGNLLASLKRFREAEAEYERALELSPDYAAARLNLGRVLAEQNRFSEAIQQHEKSLEIVPGWPDAIRELSRTHQQFGAALASQGKFDEAIVQFRQSLELTPSSARGDFLLARALSETGRFDEAVNHFELALEHRPDNADYHYEFALLLLKLERRAAALFHLRQAVQLKPDSADARRMLERVSAGAK